MDYTAAPSAGLTGDRPAAASPQGLADRRELAFIALERTRMAMVVTDPRQADHPIVMANHAFLALTGYGAEEVIGRNCRLLQGEGTDEQAIAEVREAIAAEREITIELLNYRKDGAAFWNQLYLSPIHDDAGELVYFFGSQLDVTQRRRAQELEDAERRLLREVDHRAMNVLAIVDGIVRLTRADDPTRYATSVQARVQALSKAHALLAGVGWTAPAFRRLMEVEVQSYGGDRVAMIGPDLTINPQIAQSVGLVLHELIANAVMHGALSTPLGSVQVVWREDAGRGLIRVLWTERGGPPAREGVAEGFGFRMIRAILQRQLGGEVTHSWRPEGLETAFSIPLRDAT